MLRIGDLHRTENGTLVALESLDDASWNLILANFGADGKLDARITAKSDDYANYGSYDLSAGAYGYGAYFAVRELPDDEGFSLARIGLAASADGDWRILVPIEGGLDRYADGSVFPISDGGCYVVLLSGMYDKTAAVHRFGRTGELVWSRSVRLANGAGVGSDAIRSQPSLGIDADEIVILHTYQHPYIGLPENYQEDTKDLLYFRFKADGLDVSALWLAEDVVSPFVDVPYIWSGKAFVSPPFVLVSDGSAPKLLTTDFVVGGKSEPIFAYGDGLLAAWATEWEYDENGQFRGFLAWSDAFAAATTLRPNGDPPQAIPPRNAVFGLDASGLDFAAFPSSAGYGGLPEGSVAVFRGKLGQAEGLSAAPVDVSEFAALPAKPIDAAIQGGGASEAERTKDFSVKRDDPKLALVRYLFSSGALEAAALGAEAGAFFLTPVELGASPVAVTDRPLVAAESAGAAVLDGAFDYPDPAEMLYPIAVRPIGIDDYHLNHLLLRYSYADVLSADGWNWGGIHGNVARAYGSGIPVFGPSRFFAAVVATKAPARLEYSRYTVKPAGPLGFAGVAGIDGGKSISEVLQLVGFGGKLYLFAGTKWNGLVKRYGVSAAGNPVFEADLDLTSGGLASASGGLWASLGEGVWLRIAGGEPASANAGQASIMGFPDDYTTWSAITNARIDFSVANRRLVPISGGLAAVQGKSVIALKADAAKKRLTQTGAAALDGEILAMAADGNVVYAALQTGVVVALRVEAGGAVKEIGRVSAPGVAVEVSRYNSYPPPAACLAVSAGRLWLWTSLSAKSPGILSVFTLAADSRPEYAGRKTLTATFHPDTAFVKGGLELTVRRPAGDTTRELWREDSAGHLLPSAYRIPDDYRVKHVREDRIYLLAETRRAGQTEPVVDRSKLFVAELAGGQLAPAEALTAAALKSGRGTAVAAWLDFSGNEALAALAAADGAYAIVAVDIDTLVETGWSPLLPDFQPAKTVVVYNAGVAVDAEGSVYRLLRGDEEPASGKEGGTVRTVPAFIPVGKVEGGVIARRSAPDGEGGYELVRIDASGVEPYGYGGRRCRSRTRGSSAASWSSGRKWGIGLSPATADIAGRRRQQANRTADGIVGKAP